MIQNSELIEWLKKKAEAVPMPGARKMYEAAAKALEAAQPEHGTNLAEVGTDCISRQAVIDAVNRLSLGETDAVRLSMRIADYLNHIPPAQPTFDARDTQYNLPIGKDLISRAAAIDALDKCHCGGKDENGRPWIYKENAVEAIEMVEPSPSAQPEIIRCAECKWFQCNMRQDGYLPKGVDEFECRHWCGYCDPTDFCSYAERRTNG